MMRPSLCLVTCLLLRPDCGVPPWESRSAPKAGDPPPAPVAEAISEKNGDAAPQGVATTLSPLQAESWLVELPVEGFRAARVSVPLGATEPRPVVVALHGAGDRPEWACGGWRGVMDAYAFTVCPSGEPGGAPGGFVWGNDIAVEREVNAAVEATRRRFGEYVAPGCTLLTGFSQGAIRMPPMLARGGWCPQAVLCEGAYDAVGKSFAEAFGASGGRRILLGCSQPFCAKVFASREANLRGAGIDVRTVYSGGRTHNLNGEMVSTLRKAWPWLVRDDPRWSSYLRTAASEPAN
jgi:predicted esterase